MYKKYKKERYINRLNKEIIKRIPKNEYIEQGDCFILRIYAPIRDMFFDYIIDKEDVDICKKYLWRSSSQGYAITGRHTLKLHRLVTNCPSDKVIDHIDHNVFDNRK